MYCRVLQEADSENSDDIEKASSPRRADNPAHLVHVTNCCKEEIKCE